MAVLPLPDSHAQLPSLKALRNREQNTPAQFKGDRHPPAQYACRNRESAVVQAAAPARLIEDGLPTTIEHRRRRRRFYEIAQDGNAPIAEGILRIAALYRTETMIRAFASADQRRRPIALVITSSRRTSRPRVNPTYGQILTSNNPLSGSSLSLITPPLGSWKQYSEHQGSRSRRNALRRSRRGTASSRSCLLSSCWTQRRCARCSGKTSDAQLKEAGRDVGDRTEPFTRSGGRAGWVA